VLFRSAALMQSKASLIQSQRQIHQQTVKLALIRVDARNTFKLSKAILNRDRLLMKKSVDVGEKRVDAHVKAIRNRGKRREGLKKSGSLNLSDLITWRDLEDEDDYSDLHHEELGIRESGSEGSNDSDTAPLGISHPPRESLHNVIKKSQSLPVFMFHNVDEQEYLELIDLLPSINRFTLRELDIQEILSSASLRHDLYFEENIQFKPNLDGDKGMEKKRANEAYWVDLQSEVKQGHLYRIPLLLYEIKTILIEILSVTKKEIRRDLDGCMDISLISQQIEHGSLNVTPLLSSLSIWVKEHCAPARDALVDEMVEESEKGEYVDAIRKCFELLELMKLDLVNHHLLKLRPYIVAQAVEFEWRWFKDALDLDVKSIDAALEWIRATKKRTREANGSEPGWIEVDGPSRSSTPDSMPELVSEKDKVNPSPYELVAEGILYLIQLGDAMTLHDLPETLSLDMSRLIEFNQTCHEIVLVSTLLLLFKQISGPKCSVSDMERLRDELFVIVGDSETQVQHLSTQLVHAASRIRGTLISQEEHGQVDKLVEKSIDSETSKLFELIESRVLKHLGSFIRGHTFNQELLTQHGLVHCLGDLTRLGNKVKQLVEFHVSVYGPMYASMD